MRVPLARRWCEHFMGKRKIVREGNKEDTVASVAAKACERIRSLGVGTEISISQIVRGIYLEKGYEFLFADGGHGYVWTKDGCETFSIQDTDQFMILDQVIIGLEEEYCLDFSKYRGLTVGLPYNIPFIIRARRKAREY